MTIAMQVMHQRRRAEHRAFCCCHLVAAPPDSKGRKNRFRTWSGVAHLLSRQMIHSEEATECAEAWTATIFGSTGVNRASRIADLVDSGASASGLAPPPRLCRQLDHRGVDSSSPRPRLHAHRSFTTVTAHWHDKQVTFWTARHYRWEIWLNNSTRLPWLKNNVRLVILTEELRRERFWYRCH